MIVLLNKWTISLMRRFLNDFSKETCSVAFLIWKLFAYVDNAISRVHKRGGYHTFRLNFAYTRWWWQFSRSEECTPDSITRLGWDVNTRSIQEDEFDNICVGSWINYISPNWDVIYSFNFRAFIGGFIVFIPIWWLSIEVT